ncbi:efflux RND transporter periplasmic adaptor subunit [Methylobacterium oryzihabitans]|uniref:HlyD family efflux transporter periplasmic adaptor subunit n=1 Tax=Methylobacterium oryzihabitans TaxID=2499852 RepID=A0A437P7B6_9HYPH|nr:HlyD family efflux transporter periplasmic adaptor subunit [Methylobacterium oryzihabitans]RVU18147.1 HlyD family efflux transporter periplasmic adaptor subunit [Methylobacterium oryzihabitans]
MSIRPAALAGLAAALWAGAILGAGAALAHEGHDHGAPAAPVSRTVAPRGEAASAAFELVAVLRAGTLTLHLDRFATNVPVTGATVEVETPEGARTATPAGDGAYAMPAPWLAAPGHHDLMVTVVAGDEADVLPLGLTVPEPAAAEPAAEARLAALAHAVKNRVALRDPVPAAVGAGAFVLGLATTALLRRRRLGAALAVAVLAVTLVLGSAAFAGVAAHEGHDHGAQDAAKAAFVAPADDAGRDLAQRLPDGTVFVPKPTQRLLVVRTAITESATFRRRLELPGRVIPDPNASGVVQSSVGGRLSPPASGVFPRLGTRVTRGEVLAFVTPPVQAVDASDMRQRQGELDQQIAIVQRRVERYRKLAPGGAVAQIQLDDAEAELAGLKDRRAALDAARLQPEPLVAPVDGVIAQAAAVAGQMASPGTMVFQIVDPTRLWVEALSFDPLAAAQDATARLADGRSFALTYRGSGLADRNQAVPVQFAVKGDASGLRIGQFVTVLAATEGEQAGLAVPRASVLRAANGQDVIYEHVAAERFEARPVRVEPLDGERVLIAAGIGAGRRVVTEGAELLHQVR